MSDSLNPPQHENGTGPRPEGPKEELARLRAELDRTQRTLAEVTVERDYYHRSLLDLLPKDVSFTEEDLRESETAGTSLTDIIRELEQLPEQKHG